MNSKSEKLAYKIRLHTLQMTSLGNSSHIGSIFSIVDIVSVNKQGVVQIKDIMIHPIYLPRFLFKLRLFPCIS